ncbi:serine/threonine-protein kinase [Streptomyces sp. LaPpAH-108]|uniref:serine/threonine-protein kinase n=1 Tax=Streptomyces sp. LaPpAH-108 TaxID=1155714 RepID=UPI00035EFA84|nr:serine/threonine-protein kinase [Streptomyces sp. LaPpAH-108]
MAWEDGGSLFELRAGFVLRSRYRLDSPLEQGGMGMVWQAYDQNLSRPVAVKFLAPGMATPKERAEMLKRFIQEAGVTAQFTSVLVPAVYDAGEEHGYFYLVMELIEGMSLKDLIEESQQLELPVAVSVIVPLCHVLAEAHREGIVHRDLKPSNVMISEKGYTKLLDFGIAHVPGAPEDTRLTRTGGKPGSPLYMSPEQFEGGEVTVQSDLYNLGSLLYEMLTGRPVIAGESELWERQRLRHGTHSPLGSLTVGLPTEVLDLVERLLAFVPVDRPATADEVNRVLRPYLPAPGDPPPAGFLPCDPTLPFRELFAPEGPSIFRASEPSSITRTFRPRADIKDLHHEIRRLLAEDPAKAVDLLTERLPDFGKQYGMRSADVLDLRFDLVEAFLVQGERGEAAAVCAAVRDATHNVDVLALYHARAVEMLETLASND